VSIEQPNVVDAIGVDRQGIVRLTISDHLQWDDGHVVALQEKLNAYLRFVESGEVYASYPEAKGRGIAIDVVLKHRPNQSASSFLAQVTHTLADAGLRFGYGPISSGYAEDDA
jgi:hypothetical protein